MMVYLYTELEAAVSALYAREHHPVLAATGLPQSIVKSTTIGVARIQPEGDYYQPCPGGVGAIIQPLIEWQGLPPNLDENGHLLPEPWPAPQSFIVDLIAWLPDQPEKWFFRRGEPALVLGYENLEHAALAGGLLKLSRTPLGWLKRGCEGACIINPKGLHTSFIGVAEVECEDIEHGQQFRRWIQKTDMPPQWPCVRVPDERLAA